MTNWKSHNLFDVSQIQNSVILQVKVHSKVRITMLLS